MGLRPISTTFTTTRENTFGYSLAGLFIRLSCMASMSTFLLSYWHSVEGPKTATWHYLRATGFKLAPHLGLHACVHLGQFIYTYMCYFLSRSHHLQHTEIKLAVSHHRCPPQHSTHGSHGSRHGCFAGMKTMVGIKGGHTRTHGL